jgi:hypothetical protein
MVLLFVGQIYLGGCWDAPPRASHENVGWASGEGGNTASPPKHSPEASWFYSLDGLSGGASQPISLLRRSAMGLTVNVARAALLRSSRFSASGERTVTVSLSRLGLSSGWCRCFSLVTR